MINFDKINYFFELIMLIDNTMNILMLFFDHHFESKYFHKELIINFVKLEGRILVYLNPSMSIHKFI